jgi:hypothetical protein
VGSADAAPADPAALRRRHGLEALLFCLGRKETGKNVPLLIEYVLATAARLR